MRVLKFFLQAFATALLLWLFYVTSAMAVHISYQQGEDVGYEDGFNRGYAYAVNQCHDKT